MRLSMYNCMHLVTHSVQLQQQQTFKHQGFCSKRHWRFHMDIFLSWIREYKCCSDTPQLRCKNTSKCRRWHSTCQFNARAMILFVLFSPYFHERKLCLNHMPVAFCSFARGHDNCLVRYTKGKSCDTESLTSIKRKILNKQLIFCLFRRSYKIHKKFNRTLN